MRQIFTTQLPPGHHHEARIDHHRGPLGRPERQGPGARPSATSGVEWLIMMPWRSRSAWFVDGFLWDIVQLNMLGNMNFTSLTDENYSAKNRRMCCAKNAYGGFSQVKGGLW